MAEVDVQRLLLQVDASIDLARRQMKELTTVVDNETATWDKKLEQGKKSFDKVEGSLKNVGQMRGGMQQLSFQIGDVATQMSMGTKASVIFAQQSGQVIQALQLMTSGSKGLLGVLGGPWGIVLTAAATVAASFAGKLFGARDATDELVKKMREQADQARRNELANKVWEDSIEGVREAQKKLKDEIDASLKVEAVEEQKKANLAQSRLDGQREQLKAAEDALRKAQAAAKSAPRGITAGTGSAGAVAAESSGAAALDRAVKAAEKKVADLKRNIAESEATVRSLQTGLAVSSAEASAEATKAISGFADAVKGSLTEASKAGTVAVKDFEAATIAANAYRQAQEKAASAGVKFNRIDGHKEVADLTKSFAAGETPLATYTKRLAELTKKLNDAAEAAKKAKKAGTADAGRETTKFILAADGPITSGVGTRTAPNTGGGRRGSSNHQGLDLAVPIGTPVRAPAAGTVKIGNDPKGFGIFIKIDHGGGAVSTLGHLSKVDVKEGSFVEQGQVIASSGNTGNSSGPHLHQETRVNGKAVDPRKGPIRTDRASRSLAGDRVEERAADRTVDQNDAFKQRMEQLESALLQAQMELVEGIDAQAELAGKMVDQERDRFAAALENDVNDGRLRDEQAKLLLEKADAVALQRKNNIEARKDLANAEEANRTHAQEIDIKIEGLRFEEEFAKSRQEARRIELEIIDLLYQQREADLRLAKAKAEAAGRAEEAARIQGQIDNLPAQRERDEARARRDTQSPLDQMAEDAADLTDEIEDLKARGIMGVVDTLAAAGDGWDAMKDTALAAIRQIIAELIRMQALKAIMSIVGSATGAPVGASPGFGGPGTFGTNAAVNTLPGGGLPPMGFSEGGKVRGPGSSTSDSIDAKLSNEEYVVSAKGVRKIGVPFLDAINTGKIGLPELLGGLPLMAGSKRKKDGIGAAAAFGLVGMLGGGKLFGGGGGGGIGKAVLGFGGIGIAKKIFGFAGGGHVGRAVASVPRVPSIASVPRPSIVNDNSETRGGDTIIDARLIINGGSQSKREARETQFQHERKINRALGRTAGSRS